MFFFLKSLVPEMEVVQQKAPQIKALFKSVAY